MEITICFYRQVMVMSAGTSRYRKTGAASNAVDANKELTPNEQTNNNGAVLSPISDNVDLGDVFYGIAPKISLKLEDSFEARYADSILTMYGNST